MFALFLDTGAWIGILAGAVVAAIGLTILVFFLLRKNSKSKAGKEADGIIHDAKIKAEVIVKDARLEAKQALFEAKQEAENNARERKNEIALEEQKLNLRINAIDARDAALVEKENNLEKKSETLDSSIAAYKKRQEELNEKIDAILVELEKVAGMSTQEAHDEIMARVESKMSMEIAQYIKNAEEEARDTAKAKAIDLMTLACQKYAQDVATERTVSVVAIPSDEMKGRIIGREGRNIKVLESELGVDLVIDDTPEVITVSCFDPIRREIARRALEYLVRDGRIQPGRIEEVVAKCRKEVAESTQKYGEDACFKLGLPRINKELCNYIGRLHYRTSYGQNQLEHSMEVAYLTGVMAGELGLDVNLARRAGLLHDIGKSVDFEMEGSHVELGAQIAKKYGENEVVINAIESHHGDKPARFVISHLVGAADALSAARPGARSETMETYVKRIESLETLAKSFEGVEKAYAVQAGRELRVMVESSKMGDADAVLLSQQLKDKIEEELTYPGQIHIAVIREFRAEKIAK